VSPGFQVVQGLELCFDLMGVRCDRTVSCRRLDNHCVGLDFVDSFAWLLAVLARGGDLAAQIEMEEVD
jgi:hypothetical protein